MMLPVLSADPPPSYIRCYIYEPDRSRIACKHCGWETTDSGGEGMAVRGIWVCIYCGNVGDFSIVHPFIRCTVRRL